MDQNAMGSMTATDVVVIGGGVIGLWTAWQLAAEGARVQLVDAAMPGQASAAGGGILAPIPPTGYSQALVPLLEDSLRRYPGSCEQLAMRTGISPEYWVSGCALYGHPVIETANPPSWLRDASALEGSRGSHPGAGVWLPHVAQIRPPRLLAALRAACDQLGCERWQKQVRSIDLQASRPVVCLADGQRLSTTHLVIAAGAWTGGLIPAAETRPVAGQMLALAAGDHAPASIVIESGRYLIPRKDGVVIVGSTLAIDRWSTEPDDADTRALRAFASQVHPTLAAAPQISRWCGIRPAPASLCDTPTIGPLAGREDVVLATGHYRLGLSLAPATAARVVQHVTGVRASA